MRLPTAMKEAAAIAANEVLVEWLDAVIDDPAAASKELGTTFQSYLSPELVSEADARRRIAELAAWDLGSDDGSHAGAVQRYAQAQYAAAVAVARALVAIATGVGDVPEGVAPHAAALAPLVAVVKDAIAAGSFDEESVDFVDLVEPL